MYSVERDLQVLVDRVCYSDVTTFADDYRLIDNSRWLIDNVRGNV